MLSKYINMSMFDCYFPLQVFQIRGRDWPWRKDNQDRGKVIASLMSSAWSNRPWVLTGCAKTHCWSGQGVWWINLEGCLKTATAWLVLPLGLNFLRRGSQSWLCCEMQLRGTSHTWGGLLPGILAWLREVGGSHVHLFWLLCGATLHTTGMWSMFSLGRDLCHPNRMNSKFSFTGPGSETWGKHGGKIRL